MRPLCVSALCPPHFTVTAGKAGNQHLPLLHRPYSLFLPEICIWDTPSHMYPEWFQGQAVNLNYYQIRTSTTPRDMDNEDCHPAALPVNSSDSLQSFEEDLIDWIISLRQLWSTPIPALAIHTSYDQSLLSSVGVLASLPDELRRLWHYLFFHPLWFLPEKAKWIMPGLRFPRETAVFGTHDFKLVPSTLWWLMACDPPWFMASRRHYFLGCKSWTACFPHQLPTVIVSASSTLSGMLVVKEGNGELGERIKEKGCSITDLLLSQARHLELLFASISQVFLLLGLAWVFPCPQALLDPWGDGVENENLSVTVFNLTLILRTPVHRADCAR